MRVGKQITITWKLISPMQADMMKVIKGLSVNAYHLIPNGERAMAPFMNLLNRNE